ncbi:DNA methyltransferase [Desulfobacterales bacterium HSG2]|nr:DNA methyltransferase [Desulfobacterales bacterium HSG2]
MEQTKNTLFYGDNLEILREYIPDESVDLIYLDPPFNSNRNYNVLFREESGKDSKSQITAFEDTWHWDRSAEDTYADLVTDSPPQIARMIGALREFIGENQMMAYLVMMTVRLIELHRVLKDTGSLYLHCDPTASHYLKVVLDTVFGVQNFRNEITWKRTHSHGDSKKKYASLSDYILFYSKTKQYVFIPQYIPYEQSYIDKYYRHLDEKGRKYQLVSLRSPNPRPNLVYDYKGYKPHRNGWAVSLSKMQELDRQGRLHFPKSKEGAIRKKYFLDEMLGVLAGDNWTDILPISAHAGERLGYPTQKPLALLERIIRASSNEGDLVLDPFAGCGTTIAAAEKLNRRWIGIDITHLAVSILKYRLRDMQQDVEARKGVSYQVIGEPKDLEGARRLAQDNRYQFQWWANGLVRAKPLGGTAGSRKGKKGADRGIDGIITFIDDNTKKPKRVLVQVKSGKVKSSDIRDLVGTVGREKAAIGVFITLEKATKVMAREAVSAGHYHSEGWNKKYPRIQILTIEDLFDDKIIDMPPVHTTFKQAKKEKKKGLSQSSLEM